MKKSNEKSNYLLATESKLHKTLSEIFVDSSFQFMNKRIFVNVLYVNLSADLKLAKVAINTFGLDKVDEIKLLVKELNKNFVKQTRNLIAQKMRIKVIPEIQFIHDESLEKAEKINKLIDEEAKKYNN